MMGEVVQFWIVRSSGVRPAPVRTPPAIDSKITAPAYAMSVTPATTRTGKDDPRASLVGIESASERDATTSDEGLEPGLVQGFREAIVPRQA
jgi:hypothetical protein